ncbi:hypothetical protein [Bradyrhizobium retamae]|uniref:Uncharacterized protein n=1 Tax=Bradyrhizobium retamae TaxID=1300035 RepID=A0A0R3MBQ6_9BRAD|nr:hypothetical protein [Bradyrhizobium retamae]KRR16862.1 hypothetical protein CQ13_36510 [Bradyrhizobium retamae]
MIVISPALVLSPAAASYSLNNPLFGYRNFVTADGIVADTEEDDYPASNLANPLTYPAAGWRAADTSAQYVTFTISEIDQVDYIGIAGHNFGSAAIALVLESFIAGVWTEIMPERMPADDSPLLYRFEAQSVSQIRIGLASGMAPARAAVVYIGPSLVHQRRIYVPHSPLKLSRTTDVVSGMSEASDFLGRIVLGEYVGTGIDLKNLTPDWYRANFDPFVVAAKTAPFFFAWRPLHYPNEVGFCWLTNNPKPVNQRNNGMMSVQLQVNGIV